MARHTIRGGDGTRFRASLRRDGRWGDSLPGSSLSDRLHGSRLTDRVAGQALGIETSGLRLDIVIEVVGRVVAGKAANARIVRVEAFAASEPIGLKADVGDAWIGLHGNLRPGAMALAAEIRSLFGGLRNQPMKIGRRRQIMATCERGGQVSIHTLMAMCALNTRLERVQCELLPMNGIRGMTAEAQHLLVHVNGAARSLGKAGGSCALVAHRQIETV